MSHLVNGFKIKKYLQNHGRIDFTILMLLLNKNNVNVTKYGSILFYFIFNIIILKLLKKNKKNINLIFFQIRYTFKTRPKHNFQCKNKQN